MERYYKNEHDAPAQADHSAGLVPLSVLTGLELNAILFVFAVLPWHSLEALRLKLKINRPELSSGSYLGLGINYLKAKLETGLRETIGRRLPDCYALINWIG